MVDNGFAVLRPYANSVKPSFDPPRSSSMTNADFDTRSTDKPSCAATDPDDPTGRRGSTTLRAEGTRNMVTGTERGRNEVILAARVLLILLFVVFG